MSAVDQGYRYAINLPCDWIIVTSMRQTRLYHKGSDQYTYERFDTEALAADLKKFIFLLSAERVGFITSGSWVGGNFGGPLRKYLAEQARIESLIDFGEYQ